MNYPNNLRDQKAIGVNLDQYQLKQLVHNSFSRNIQNTLISMHWINLMKNYSIEMREQWLLHLLDLVI